MKFATMASPLLFYFDLNELAENVRPPYQQQSLGIKERRGNLMDIPDVINTSSAYWTHALYSVNQSCSAAFLSSPDWKPFMGR